MANRNNKPKKAPEAINGNPVGGDVMAAVGDEAVGDGPEDNHKCEVEQALAEIKHDIAVLCGKIDDLDARMAKVEQNAAPVEYGAAPNFKPLQMMSVHGK
jgi:hypothetical protein